jgi:spore coat protein U-like protein
MFPDPVNRAAMHVLEDDFDYLDTTKWTDLNDGATGTNTADDIAGGQASLVTAAAANDYHFYTSKSRPFLIAAKKPLWFTSRFKAGTLAGMQYMGLSSVLTAGIATDTTGVVSTNFSGAMFFSLPGTLNFGLTSSNGAAQTTNAAILVLVTGQWYTVDLHWDTGDGITSQVKAEVYDETAGKLYQPAPQPVTIAGLAQMGMIFGVKSAGAAETLSFDYIRCGQLR